MAQSFNDSGVIIKTQDYGEADKIISLLTNKHGLIHCIAVGSRRQNSKKAPHLDLISHIKFSANLSHTQFYLTQADSLNFFPHIKGNLTTTALVLSFLEILYSLVPSELVDSELYSSLVNFLTAINDGNQEKTKTLSKQFGAYLIRHLGYPPPPPTNTSLSDYFETLMSKKIIGREIG